MYTREEAFEHSVQAKAEEVINLCTRLGISTFMSFALRDDGKTTTYKNYMYGSLSNGIRLTDDQIRRHVNVANGFWTIPPTSEVDDYEDF